MYGSYWHAFVPKYLCLLRSFYLCIPAGRFEPEELEPLKRSQRSAQGLPVASSLLVTVCVTVSAAVTAVLVLPHRPQDQENTGAAVQYSIVSFSSFPYLSATCDGRAGKRHCRKYLALQSKMHYTERVEETSLLQRHVHVSHRMSCAYCVSTWTASSASFDFCSHLHASDLEMGTSLQVPRFGPPTSAMGHVPHGMHLRIIARACFG